VKLLSIMWRDVRVPVIARVLICLAPLYWICPFDLNPDFLPGGYTDDLWIVPIVIVIAAKMIPLAVFCDARKAAAHAVCGIMCLSFTVIPSEHSAVQSKAPSTALIISSERPKFSDSQNAHISMTKCISAVTEPTAACLEFGQTGAVPLAYMSVSYRENEQRRSFRRPSQRLRVVGRVMASSFLLARGGQIQLYGIDGDATPAVAMLIKPNPARVKFCRLQAQAVFLSRKNQTPDIRRSSYKDKRLVEKAAC
jgi:uncharacterized membrane protein YkvA (DUF1232 family)